MLTAYNGGSIAYNAIGNPTSYYNGTVYYYVTNLQGDVMHIVNASGTVVASYDYDPLPGKSSLR